MVKQEKFGFKIELKAKSFGYYYIIHDLSNDRFVFRADYSLSKEKWYSIVDEDRNERIRIDPAVSPPNTYRISMEKEQVGTLHYGLTSKGQKLTISYRDLTYSGSKITEGFYDFIDENYNTAFSLERSKKNELIFIIEIREPVEPLVALIVAIVLIVTESFFSGKFLERFHSAFYED